MIYLYTVIPSLIAFVLFIILAFCVFLYAVTSPFPKIWRDESEKFFIDGKTGRKVAFPSIDGEFTVKLSVIVPAYNEEERLVPMLDECLEYLESRKKSGLTYEVIVVSDGSLDRTVAVAQSYAEKYETVRVLDLVKNRGKGGAVRLGIQSARGCLLLFADADGATKFRDIEKLEESLKDVLKFDYTERPHEASLSSAVICGSRAHLEEEATATRSIFRLILMHGFHFLVWAFCVRGVRDTQCGFKLFTRQTARTLFQALHVERWAFDVEMLYIAQTLNIPIREICVNWTEIEGSKVVPFWSWLQMGRDLGLIWLRYTIGAWKIDRPKQS